MNKIGKILVFVNLLFSVVTGALIVMVFVTRTQWQKGYIEMSARVRQADANLLSTVEERNKIVGEKNKALAQAELDLKNTKDENAVLKETTKAAIAAMDKKDKEKIASDAVAAQLRTENTNILAENKRKDELLVARDEALVKSTKDGKEYRDQAIKSTIRADSVTARNENLVKQVENMTKELEAVRSDKQAKFGQQRDNPPPEDVKGTIKSTDSSGLVVINLGSDSGLSKGNTLHVYRTAPKPTYVGLLRIQDVRQNEAVAELLSSARPGLIQVGDQVASKILDNR